MGVYEILWEILWRGMSEDGCRMDINYFILVFESRTGVRGKKSKIRYVDRAFRFMSNIKR